jgi:Mce-associated membrane protein
MASRERSAEAPDDGAGMLDDRARDIGDASTAAAEAAEAEAAEAEAEAEAAEAEARALAARARALRLRKQAQQARDGRADGGAVVSGETPESGETVESEALESRAPESAEAIEPGDGDVAVDGPPAPSGRLRLPRLPRPGWRRVSIGAAIVTIGALLGASGYIVWHHRDVLAQQRRTAEFSAAARQGVINLMTIDFNKAKEDVQRVIDDSTGKFKQDYQSTADDLVKALQQSKVVTKVTVNGVAVESMTDNSAVVLVAARSEATSAPDAAKRPAAWRVRLTLTRDGGQLKMSNVEFV